MFVNDMPNFMCKPNVIVYLDVKPSRSLERVRMRERGVESGITLEYLEALYQEYEKFLGDVSRTVPVIRVDWDQFHDADEMAQMIEREYLHSSFLREAKWSPTHG